LKKKDKFLKEWRERMKNRTFLGIFLVMILAALIVLPTGCAKDEKMETGLKVTVTVNHVMNPETPHYIMNIKLKDGEGQLLGEKEFQATDEKAEAIFELFTVPSKLMVYERCNLHGLWMDEVDVTTE
jgi:desulfoferrodoxin (superoxide reductase-like protein)